MSDRLWYSLFELKNRSRIRYCYRMNQITNTFFHKEYRHEYKKFCGKKVLDEFEINRLISTYIESEKPFWIGRYGHTELSFLISALGKRFLNEEKGLDERLYALCNNAGFFPNDKRLVEKYTDLILGCCQEMDVHAMWPLYMEDYLVSRYEKGVPLFKYVYLEPWAMSDFTKGVLPWSHSLKAKKVLVVHPFEDTIKSQYEKNRSRIFENMSVSSDSILPEFELKTLKAVQTIAGNKDERFDSWFEALDWMVEECKKIDFDVAILGCGSYGFPLAAEIKRMGKGAIQLCGATQLMFGIIGSRWENNQAIQNLVNDAWVRPAATEIVNNMKSVEDACYW